MMYDYSPEDDKKLVDDYLKQKALADDEARQGRLAAGLGEAGATIGAAMSGIKVDSPFYQGLADQADKGAKEKMQVVDYLAKKDQELADRIAKKKQNEATALAEQEKLKWEKDKFNAEQSNKAQELGLKRQELAAGKESKIEEKNQTLNVPGFQLGDNVKPGITEAKDARESLATFKNVNANLDQLGQLVDKYGAFEYGGAGGAQMDSISTAIRLDLKEMAKLGVLSSTDYALLDKQLQDPSSIAALFTKGSTSKAQIDALKRNLTNKFALGMEAKGYKPDELMADQIKKNQGGMGSAIAAPQAKPIGEMSISELDAEIEALSGGK